MTKNSLKTQITCTAAKGTEIIVSSAAADGGGATNSEGGTAKGRTWRVGRPKPDQSGADPTQIGVGRDADKPAESAAVSEAATAPAGSKLDRLVALLRTPSGTTLPELVAATGWQVHSVRGAMAGALRKKGHSVISEKPDGGVRRYRIGASS